MVEPETTGGTKMDLQVHTGYLVSIIPIPRVLSKGKDGKIYPFSLEQVVGYTGQKTIDMKEFGTKGFMPGIPIEYTLTETGEVAAVMPLYFRDLLLEEY
ncbi:MAG TPA: hypothetical protein VM103_00940 [Candidatus Paceibacterota bacterium]|nr:hypothetical protein [Candidatus Paceibacterota bacterium]